MADSSTVQQIMKQVSAKAHQQYVSKMNYLNADGVASMSGISDYFAKLADLTLKNGVFKDKELDDKAVSSKATTFALHTITRLYAGDNLKECAREFFADKKNDAWFEAQKIGADEKKQLLEDIQTKLDVSMDPRPVTAEGKKFVADMKEALEEAKKTRKDDFIEQGLNYIFYTNQNMQKTGKGEKAFDSALESIKKTGGPASVAEKMHENLSGKTKEIAQEVILSPEHIHEFTRIYAGYIYVRPREFVDRAEKGRLNNQDKAWANQKVKNISDNIASSQRASGNVNVNISVGDYQMNGKPMFSSKELSQKLPEDIASSIIMNLLKGQNVSVKSPSMNAPVQVEPKSIEKESSDKTIWQQIVELLIELLTNPEKTKAASNEKKAETVEKKVEAVEKKVEPAEKKAAAKTGQLQSRRVKISFSELAGLNPFSKVTAPPAKQREIELTEIKKAPELKGR